MNSISVLLPIIEIGKVNLNYNKAAFLLSNQIVEPVIIARPPTYNETDAVAVRHEQINGNNYRVSPNYFTQVPFSRSIFHVFAFDK